MANTVKRAPPGGTLVAVPAPPPHPDADDSGLVASDALVRRELTALLRSLIAVRIWGAPLLVVIALVVLWVDPAPWRHILLGLVVVGGLLASLLAERHVRTRGVTLRAAGPNLAAMAIAQLTVITVTGGIDSPLLPIVLPLGLLSTVAMGRRPATWVVLGLQVGGLFALTGVQASGVAPGLDMAVLHQDGPVSPAVRVMVGVVMVMTLVVASTVGLHIRRRFEGMNEAGLQARSEQLQTWKTWSSDLESLSGEIAHELKNPLASIKGLAALVGRDLPVGKTRQRMDVLESEVQRMQDIVDEFLMFSRPLTPLVVAPVDIVALCERVVLLHEGYAVRRGVRVVCSGRSPAVPGDARKLLQVLVNLVQNAIEASPDKREVGLRLSAGDDAVVIEVVDEGPGVPQALKERVFEAGVSGGEGGSGLGLPIARAIARQHGGELVLLARPQGGTVARLTLPRSPR